MAGIRGWGWRLVKSPVPVWILTLAIAGSVRTAGGERGRAAGPA